jgi:hypothetical protein
MNKKTQMYLGVGVLALAAYYFWNKSKSPKANAAGKSYQRDSCKCHTSSSMGMYDCGDGTHYSTSSMGPCGRGKK